MRGDYVLNDVLPGSQHVLIRYIGHTLHRLHALVPPRGILEIDVARCAEPVRLTSIRTFIRDPSIGERPPIEMRPLSPFLVGLDWQL